MSWCVRHKPSVKSVKLYWQFSLQKSECVERSCWSWVGLALSWIWQRQLAQSNHEIPPSVDHTHRQWPFCRGIWEVPLTELAIKSARYYHCSMEKGLNIALNMSGIVSSFCVPYMKYDFPLKHTRVNLGGRTPIGLRSLFPFQRKMIRKHHSSYLVSTDNAVLLAITYATRHIPLPALPCS